MNFKVDENLPSEVTQILRAAGHDAVSVLDQQLGGAEDPDVDQICLAEERILVTLDIGFGDIRSYPPEARPGILVLRLRSQEKERILQVVQRLIPALAKERLRGAIWVVEENRIRIRV